MKWLIAFIVLFLSSNCYSDWDIDCKSKELSEVDIRICSARESASIEQTYIKLMQQLKTGLLNRIGKEEDVSPGFDLNSIQSLNKLGKSDDLWRALSEIDCGIEIDSIGGGIVGSAAYSGCMADQYNNRIRQLKSFSEFWFIEIKM